MGSAPPRDGDRGRAVAIRAARAADLHALAAVEREAATRFAAAGLRGAFLDATLPHDALADAAAQGRLWVADHEGACVGFALAAMLDDGDAWLEEVDVVPAFGGLGIGRRLVEAAAAWARGRGASSLALSTFRDLPWNAPFYAGMGFREIAADARPPSLQRIVEEEGSRGLPVERRVLMRLELAGSTAKP